jgi:hypothetical protein
LDSQIKITFVSQGKESTYSTCNTEYHKDADTITLLIKASHTKGSKYLLSRNKNHLESIIHKFKVPITDYVSLEVKYLHELFDNMLSISDSTFFIFSFHTLGVEPEPPQSEETPFRMKSTPEDNLVFKDFDQQECKSRFIKYSSENNIDIYLTEFAVPIQQQINDDKRHYIINKVEKGKVHKTHKTARRVGNAKDSAAEDILELALVSNNGSIIYYPIDEEDYITFDRIDIVTLLIWIHLKRRNVAISNVPRPKYDFENDGEGIETDSSLDTQVSLSELSNAGFKIYSPTKEEIERRNSIYAIKHYLKEMTSKYFNDREVEHGIKSFMQSHIDSNKIELIPITSSLLSVEASLQADSSQKSVCILHVGDFYNYSFEPLSRIINWAQYFKINLYFSTHSHFFPTRTYKE